MKVLWVLTLLAIAADIQGKSIKDIENETNGRVILQRGPTLKRSSLAAILPREVKEDTTTTPEPCTDSDRLTCADNKLTGCIEGEKITLTCADALGSRTGYCNCAGDDCQATIPSNCPTPPKTTCPGSPDGEKLPDNKDCKAFTYCDKEILYQLKCLDNLIYNPTEGRCSSGTCRTCTCPSTSSIRPVYVPFPQDSSYYLLCYKGKTTIKKCSTEGYIAEKTGCVFGCKKTGMFGDTNFDRANEGYYYSCTGVAPLFKRTQYQCQKGQYFDEKKGFCIEGQLTTTTTTEEPKVVKP